MNYCFVNDENRITNIIVCDDPQFASEIKALPCADDSTIGDPYIPLTLPDPDLEANKASRIAQSKADLAAYLAAHPIQWTDGAYYSITAEKQQQLTSKIMAATMAQTLSTDYNLTWNSTGEVCKTWTLQDLAALAFAIDARVTALVSYQQTQEVAMRDAATQEELDAIVVDYDSVKEASA